MDLDRTLVGKKPHFRPAGAGANFYRVLFYLFLILVLIWLLLSMDRGEVISPFEPTPTPTRVSESYFMEAQAYFDAGKLDDPKNNQPGVEGPAINDAIEAYKAALEGDPTNAKAWAELARIQTYSSSMLRNDTERFARLGEALDSANRAAELAPDDSEIQAIRAFALDWYASSSLTPREQVDELMADAERTASLAIRLDPEEPLALAFYAEILADTQKWLQAEKYASQAVQLGPDLMDTHRVLGYVRETLAQYNSAIQEYQAAAELAPNLTFLYLRIGQNYREAIKNPDRALEYFERAARINEQLEIENPNPHIEIAKTYTQQGQFFAASINARRALELDNRNAHVYGQLGMIFRRARNYEGANPLLKCAAVGCTAAENEMGGVDVTSLPLTSLTVAYYYVEYGTNLAFLSRPNENYCTRMADGSPSAREVLQMVMDAYPDDPYLTAIAQDSLGLCARVEGGAVEVEATPTPEGGEEDMLPAAEGTPTPEG